MLPQPIGDLRAKRTGNTVVLRWTMPVRTTDRVTLKGAQQAVVCRAQGGSCVPAGSVLFAPGIEGVYRDALPPELRTGTPRPLRYTVRLQNHRGADAGPSNPALTAAGSAPPTVQSVEAEPTQAGIVVRWRTSAADSPPAQTTLLVRLRRERVLRAGENAKPLEAERNAGVQQQSEQTLEAKEHVEAGAWTPDRITDAQAVLNRSYRYHVELAEQVPLDGRLVEICGVGAQTEVITADDRFPPAIPANLVAVANPEGGTIDLSWSPDSEPDLRGYFVYRREAGSAAAPKRVSGLTIVPLADWSDRTARKGTRYAYSVSAVDGNGNESGRTRESVETLP